MTEGTKRSSNSCNNCLSPTLHISRALLPLLLSSSLYSCLAERGRRREKGREMKKSIVDELFPRREAALQTKSDILSSIFPPCPTGAGNYSSHLERTVAGRKQAAEDQNSNVNTRGSSSRYHSTAKRNGNPVYLCELPESCLMSSSVYYGGRDDFIPDSSYDHYSGRPYTHKIDYKEGDSSNSDVATRGDWWQGSYYY